MNYAPDVVQEDWVDVGDGPNELRCSRQADGGSHKGAVQPRIAQYRADGRHHLFWHTASRRQAFLQLRFLYTTNAFSRQMICGCT